MYKVLADYTHIMTSSYLERMIRNRASDESRHWCCQRDKENGEDLDVMTSGLQMSSIRALDMMTWTCTVLRRALMSADSITGYFNNSNMIG